MKNLATQGSGWPEEVQETWVMCLTHSVHSTAERASQVTLVEERGEVRNVNKPLPPLPCARHSGIITRPLLDLEEAGAAMGWWSLNKVAGSCTSTLGPYPAPGPGSREGPGWAPVSTVRTT